jgi:hypothetical protein
MTRQTDGQTDRQTVNRYKLRSTGSREPCTKTATTTGNNLAVRGSLLTIMIRAILKSGFNVSDICHHMQHIKAKIRVQGAHKYADTAVLH